MSPRGAVDPKLQLTPLGVERVGVYRFVDAEIVAFEVCVCVCVCVSVHLCAPSQRLPGV